MRIASDPSTLGAENVWFDYGAEPVLCGVSLSVGQGDMIALAGPNGSGKTTLLKLLTGIRPPTRGKVLLDGRDISRAGARARARRIAVVSQHVDPSLMFSVEHLVAMGRSPYSSWFGGFTDTDRQAVQRAMEQTHITGFAERRFGDLSGGEQQRVMVAMALAQQAPYLLLDEPTVHLDLYHQHDLLELLRELNRELGIAVLAVMHDLNLAALYFDRVALLERGVIVGDGLSGDVLRDQRCLAIFRAPLRVINHPEVDVPQVLLQRRPLH